MRKVSTHSRPKAAGNTFANKTTTAKFQHTAARRRLEGPKSCAHFEAQFQHTAARRRLDELKGLDLVAIMFQHTAARRRLELWDSELTNLALVSTHSRPKAAGASHSSHKSMRSGFNTQPPEGGWASNRKVSDDCLWFQHTAARRRLVGYGCDLFCQLGVSTHSRPKAAGCCRQQRIKRQPAFQHTAARRRLG